jgi:hypothetical protein
MESHAGRTQRASPRLSRTRPPRSRTDRATGNGPSARVLLFLSCQFHWFSSHSRDVSCSAGSAPVWSADSAPIRMGDSTSPESSQFGLRDNIFRPTPGAHAMVAVSAPATSACAAEIPALQLAPLAMRRSAVPNPADPADRRLASRMTNQLPMTSRIRQMCCKELARNMRAAQPFREKASRNLEYRALLFNLRDL